MLKNTIEQLKKHEGLRLKVYDCPAGKKTIGYGRNLEDRGITEDEANQLLLNDVNQINIDLKVMFPPRFWFEFKQFPDYIQSIFINMAYQMGIDGFFKFRKTIQLVIEKNYEKASLEMLNSKWAKQTPNRAKELSNLMKGGK